MPERKPSMRLNVTASKVVDKVKVVDDFYDVGIEELKSISRGYDKLEVTAWGRYADPDTEELKKEKKEIEKILDIKRKR
jgi:hypothetical protein